jgi:hypothetical protein
MAKPKPELRHSKLRGHKVPAWIARDVGRIIIRWAHLEYRLQEIAYLLLNVTEEQGRVAVQERRAVDRIDMIVDLAHLRRIKIDENIVKTIKSSLRVLSSRRDLFAHGLWVRYDDGTWHVILMRGNWNGDAEIPHRSRRISPEGIKATVDGFASIRDEIDKRLHDIRKIRELIEGALESLPEKRS